MGSSNNLRLELYKPGALVLKDFRLYPNNYGQAFISRNGKLEHLQFSGCKEFPENTPVLYNTNFCSILARMKFPDGDLHSFLCYLGDDEKYYYITLTKEVSRV